MCVSFQLTTPLGIAIGVGIASSYNPDSTSALLAQGILDAIASGILIYVSLVDLLATEMLFDRQFKSMHATTKVFSFLFMYLGLAVMAIIGIWL